MSGNLPGAIPQAPVQGTVEYKKVEGEEIVVEIMKDQNGVIKSNNAYSKASLLQNKAQVQGQYNSAMTRLTAMLSLVGIPTPVATVGLGTSGSSGIVSSSGTSGTASTAGTDSTAGTQG